MGTLGTVGYSNPYNGIVKSDHIAYLEAWERYIATSEKPRHFTDDEWRGYKKAISDIIVKFTERPI